MNRQQLQETYVHQVLDDMDPRDAIAILFDFMSAELNKMTDEELTEEIGQFYPELLEGWIMSSTYCIASNLFTRTYEWYGYTDGKVFQYNSTPIAFTAVQIAGFHSSLYHVPTVHPV